MELNYNVAFSNNINEYLNLKNYKVLGHTYNVSTNAMIDNLEFNQVYYLYNQKQLTAFKLLAYSVVHNLYLIQTPTKSQWVNLKSYRIFANKEHYFAYLENKEESFKFHLTNIDLRCLYLKQNESCTLTFSLYHTYFWDDSQGKPKAVKSKIYDILYTENGFVIYYDLPYEKRGYYYSYEECLQSRLNGFEICDFDEENEPTLHISIKIKQKETKPKIHTLRFIEE